MLVSSPSVCTSHNRVYIPCMDMPETHVLYILIKNQTVQLVMTIMCTTAVECNHCALANDPSRSLIIPCCNIVYIFMNVHAYTFSAFLMPMRHVIIRSP